MQDILNPGSENSMNVLLAGRDIPKRQNVSMRSDNMQVRAHIQHILTRKDLPRNKNYPLDSSDIDLEYFENLQKKNHPNSLFSLLQMHWKMTKYFLVQVNSSLNVCKKKKY